MDDDGIVVDPFVDVSVVSIVVGVVDDVIIVVGVVDDVITVVGVVDNVIVVDDSLSSIVTVSELIELSDVDDSTLPMVVETGVVEVSVFVVSVLSEGSIEEEEVAGSCSQHLFNK